MLDWNSKKAGKDQHILMHHSRTDERTDDDQIETRVMLRPVRPDKSSAESPTLFDVSDNFVQAPSTGAHASDGQTEYGHGKTLTSDPA